MPWDLSDQPLYNMRAVVEATGVPAPSLRSWERRYGLPAPTHDERGYRLYSARDIGMVRWIRARVQEGVAVSRAIAMLREIVAVRPAPPAPPPGDAPDTARMARDLVCAISQMDEDVASRVISDALQRISVEDVLLHVLQPTLYGVGERWAEGSLTVTAERFGSNLIRGYLAQLLRVAAPPLRGERILIGCAPGEQHELGPLMLALFVRRAGFDVLYVGANLEAESFLADVDRLAPAAVCLGASTSLSVPPLAEIYRSLRGDFRGVLAFGGRAFIQDPALIDTVPGQYLGPDADTAVVALRAALAEGHHA